jgi:thioesterase domain-containing protein
VILASREVAADPFRLAELMQRSGCTVMQATPATWRALIETGWTGTPGLTILCGGEALTRDLADQLLTRGASVWNMYGPTETTIWSSVFRVEPGTDPVPIGRPIANTGMYVLDARRTPVPAGVPGDLYISGDGLARGYRGREDLTRERFVMSPAVPGVRLYHTGDRARRRSDGLVEFLGRVDRQVKIRGFRVELGEVETALERHPAIAVAAVRAWPDSSGDASLAAYLVARNEPLDTSDLRQHLRRSLPEYMVPSHFVWMAALPLTPNGKVDHRALPEPEGSPPPAELVPAGSETERRLAAIWQEALNVPRLGMLDNFFDLGGHSLLIAKVLRRIETELGVRLPMAALFHAPNVRQLAGLLRDPLRVTQLPPTMPWQARGSRPPLLWLDGGPAFRALAQAIGPDQPFLGVELPPAELQQVSPGARIADIARLFVRLVRAVQPEGPYYIGGFCARGILAYEVASQLTGEGSHVGLVILLHTANPVPLRRISALALLLSRFKYHVGHVSRMGPRDGCAYLVARSRVALARRRERDSRRPGDQRAGFGEITEQAAFAYEPPPYDGDVALFQPADALDVCDYRPGWTGVVQGELSSYTLPGDHTSMLDEPYVEALGAAIRSALLRAQAGGSHRLPAAA